MELRTGYKKTEIGLIPEDWDTASLGSIGVSLIGLTYAPTDVRRDGILVLRSSNIQNDALAFDDNVFVEKHIPEKIMVVPGDVLICVRNGSRDLIGKAALLDSRTNGMTFGAFMAVFRSEIGALINYHFQSDILRRQINEHLGATINQITNRSLNAFRIPVPRDADELRAIQEALFDVDASIAALSRLIAKKRNLRQGAMQRLLTGHTRLPGFTAPWQEKRLGELGSWRGGMTPSMQIAYFWEGGSFPWLSSGDVKTPTLHDSGMHITEAAIDSKATTVVPAGSIVFVMRSGILRKYFPVASIERSMAINQDIKALTVAADYDPTFIRQMLHWRGDDVLQSCLKTGTTVESIDFGWLKAFELRLPSTRAEQSAIAQALSDMDGEVAALDARLGKTRGLKQAMMQALLTGRVRLPIRRDAAPQMKEAAHG